MSLGLSTASFTLLHVIISLLGLVSGIVVLLGLESSRRLPGWTALFLVTTIATSATGFLFHSAKFGRPHVVGVISLVVLAVAVLALYGLGLRGPWRAVYVISAILALYLNAFVGVVQAFDKVAFLHPLAPTGSEPPFVVAQAAVLAIFALLATLAVRRFHPVTPLPA